MIKLKQDQSWGAEASVAAGPVGRTAQASTNARMQAQMLSTLVRLAFSRAYRYPNDL